MCNIKKFKERKSPKPLQNYKEKRNLQLSCKKSVQFPRKQRREIKGGGQEMTGMADK